MKWYQPMVGASHSTNTDDIPGTCKQTISQNKLGYAAVTPPPPNPHNLAHTYFSNAGYLGLLGHVYRDPGWLGEALSRYLHGCQDRIAKTVLSELSRYEDLPIGSEKFLNETVLSFHCPKSKAYGPQLISRGRGRGFLPHPQERKEPEKSWSTVLITTTDVVCLPVKQMGNPYFKKRKLKP